MDTEWTQERIQQLVDNQIQEDLTLEYKAADALLKDDKHKFEITKDVSAMANSAGGTIIYGVAEERIGNENIPVRIDPIKHPHASKEWLEQVITGVRPRIQDLEICSIHLSNDLSGVVYAVTVPPGSTAHQATDKRYYKRYNYQLLPMDDHEIRDVMGRQQHPRVVLEFEIKKFLRTRPPMSIEDKSAEDIKYKLVATATNIGASYAKYVNCFVDVPLLCIPNPLQYMVKKARHTKIRDGIEYIEWAMSNTIRDLIRSGPGDLNGTRREEFGPGRYDPILPGLTHRWDTELKDNITINELGELLIFWESHADSAPPIHGAIRLGDIQIV